MSKLRYKFGDNEVELEGSEAFIVKYLKAFYERTNISPTSVTSQLKKDIAEPPKKEVKGQVPTPAEFYTSKKKTDGISKILIFAKYLDLYRNISEFTPAQLNEVAKEAKLARDIHAQYFVNAVKQGLLRSHGKHVYSLTLSAESVLSAM